MTISIKKELILIKTYDIIQKKSEMGQCGQIFGISENIYGTVQT